MKIAIKSMGLDDLKPFNPREKVIEYLLEDAHKSKKLIDLTVKALPTRRHASLRPPAAAPYRPIWVRSAPR